MASRCGPSLSRSLLSAARASTLRSPPPLPRIRPPSPRRVSIASPSRSFGQLGCAQSLLPLLGSASLASRLVVDVRAFSELSHGTTFRRTCPDR